MCDESIMPRGLARILDYEKQVERLERIAPNIIVLTNEEVIPDYLQEHQWCKADILRTLPVSLSWFNAAIGRKLPFILNTRKIRDAYPEFFENMTLEARNARYLYAPRDLASWLQENMISTVETVLVPLTMFATNPDQMRDTFRRVSSERLSESFASQTRQQLFKSRLAEWPEIRNLIRPELRDHVGVFADDLNHFAEIQGTEHKFRVKLPAVQIRLPKDRIPFFLLLNQIGQTRGYRASADVSKTTCRTFGWAKHQLRSDLEHHAGTNERLVCNRTFYTPGLWFGGNKTIWDYENGLVEPMTVTRFVRVFGENALHDAQWRWSKDMCPWFEENCQFGPGNPPVTQGALLGLNWTAPRGFNGD